MQMDDYLRSFGMSGLLISNEMRNVEERYDLILGHVHPAVQQGNGDYYPQFERDVRREAAQMAQHYELFYCLEQAIRKIVTETLLDAVGPSWWQTNVNAEIRKYVADIQKTDDDNGFTRRSERAIDYTTFGHLSVIITSNWNEFRVIFQNQSKVQRIMRSLNLLRGPIAHCCPLAEDEVLRLRLAVKDWFRMIG